VKKLDIWLRVCSCLVIVVIRVGCAWFSELIAMLLRRLR